MVAQAAPTETVSDMYADFLTLHHLLTMSCATNTAILRGANMYACLSRRCVHITSCQSASQLQILHISKCYSVLYLTAASFGMWLQKQFVPMQKLEEEVAQLQAANAELLKDKEEALPLLEAYRSAHTCLHPAAALCFFC